MLLFAIPAMAIEDINVEQNSTNLTDFADYTGEKFFKSTFELQEEREKKNEFLKKQFNSKFYPNYRGGHYAFLNERRSMPPLKRIRLDIAKSYQNFKEKRLEKKQKNTQDVFVDANGIAENIEELEEEAENEVLKEEAEEVQTMLKCRTVKYLPETNEMEAIGDVKVIFPQQNTTLYSQRMTYNTLTNIIQLYDNVRVVRDGHEVLGEYMKVDLNEESGLLKNLRASDFNLDIEAENGYLFGDNIISENGKITSQNDNLISLRSSGFGDALKSFILPREDMVFLLNDVDNCKYFIKVDKIKIKAKEAHDTIQLKHPVIYNKSGKKILSVPSMTFYANKEHDYFEGNYPELGSISAFGMYVGPGIVLETPFGSTLKLIPTVNYKNKFGFGGLARFKSGTNQSILGYNTAAERFILKGYQKIDDNLILQYGANSYIDNWFLGQSWLGYGGELLYEKGYLRKDFLYDKASLSFRNRISAGVFRENARSGSNKYYSGYHRMSTVRFKYMAELNQRLYSLYGDVDNSDKNGWRQVDFSVIGQGSVALYGTGDTQFIGRIGPRLTTQYKNWRQELGYYLSGYDDNTPMLTFDYYRYGTSNVYLREYWRAHKYVTLGLYTSYNLSDDIYDYTQRKKSQLREAAFYVALGPDDLKLNLGYDFIRQNTYFGVSVAMSTKGTSIDYKKLEIQNPGELGKSKYETNIPDQEPVFVAPPSPYRTKATVENIEDATTYMRGEPL